MSAHNTSPSPHPQHAPHPATRAAAAAVILLALGACSTTATVPGSPVVAPSTASFGTGGHAATLTGAGSTFDAPFFDQAFAQYHQHHPAASISYTAVGSSAGIAAFSAKQADFGASDVPMTASEQAAATGGPSVQVPVVLGAEVIAYNLTLPSGQRLHLTGPVIARIFLGQITNWHDPAITALNPGITIPGAPITVVHRSDGSGTTYIFSNYLSSTDPTWAAKVGTGKTLHWPVGEGAEGNASVAATVFRTPFSIGYVERSYTHGLVLPFAAIRNRAGHYVIPTTADHHRRRRPKTPHHPSQLLHRQPARRQQLPHHRLQLGADLHPPARPEPRAGTGQHAGLAHPHRPGLRRREPLRTPATPGPATRPHHAPADHRPQRDAPAGLSVAPVGADFTTVWTALAEAPG